MRICDHTETVVKASPSNLATQRCERVLVARLMIRGQVASGKVALRLGNAYFEQDVYRPTFREHLILQKWL